MYTPPACSRDGHLAGSMLTCTQMCRRDHFTVNSENDKNLQSDSWRFHQMNKETGDPDHPWCKFSTGNKDTLADAPKKQGLDTRQALLDFHAKYYSSHIMGLVSNYFETNFCTLNVLGGVGG